MARSNDLRLKRVGQLSLDGVLIAVNPESIDGVQRKKYPCYLTHTRLGTNCRA